MSSCWRKAPQSGIKVGLPSVGEGNRYCYRVATVAPADRWSAACTMNEPRALARMAATAQQLAQGMSALQTARLDRRRARHRARAANHRAGRGIRSAALPAARGDAARRHRAGRCDDGGADRNALSGPQIAGKAQGKAMTTAPQRFNCIDCGCPTFLVALGARVPGGCGICQTIAPVGDRGEGAALRARHSLYDSGVNGAQQPGNGGADRGTTESQEEAMRSLDRISRSRTRCSIRCGRSSPATIGGRAIPCRHA